MSRGSLQESNAESTAPVSPFAFFLSALALIILLGLAFALLLFANLGAFAAGAWRLGASAYCQGKGWVVSNWNKERAADLYEVRVSLQSLREFLGPENVQAQRERARKVLSVMQAIRNGFNLDAVALLDGEGRVLLQEPYGGVPSSSRLKTLVADALQQRSVVIREEVLTPDGGFIVGYFLALDEKPQATRRDVVLSLWVDAGPFLKGLLWPPKNLNFGFENAFVLADGRELHLVSHSQARSGAVLELRERPSGLGSPTSGSAPRRGLVRTQTMQPPQFFEVEAAVQGAPWTLKARVPVDAILAYTWFHSLYSGGVASLLLFSLGCAVFAYWRQRVAAMKLRLVRAELDRSRLQRHYESVVQQANDVLIWADTHGQILDANRRAVELYGYSLDELRRMRLPELRPPTQRNASEQTIQEVRSKGHHTFSATHQKKNGECIPVEVTARLIRFEGEELILGTVRDVSEREQAQASLRESEDRLKAALRHASVVLARQDAELRYTHWYGRPLPGYVGETAPSSDENLFDPAEAERLRDIKVGVLATGEGARTEVRRRGRSGDLWLDVIVEPERDASGRVTGLINIMLDITERKLAQELLQSSEQKYRRLVEQVPGAVYARALNPEFSWIYISPQVRDMLGFTPLEWTQTPGLPERHIHPEDLPVVLKALRSCIERGRPVVLDYRILHRDGRLLWFRDRISLARAEDGAASHIQGLLTDITEMRLAQEQVHTLSIAIEHSPFSIAIADASGIVEYANAEFCRVLQRSREETLGRPLLELRPEYAHLAAGDLPQQVLAGSILQGELPGKHRNGSAYWERVILAGAGGSGRMAQHIVVVSQDITEIRQYAEEVRQLQKMEAVGRLAGGIAHDFNNVLTIVRGYSELLLDEMREDDPHREPVEEIRKAAGRGTQMVDQLLAFSRKQAVHPASLDLNRVIEAAHSMLARLLGEDIRIEAALAPGLPPVRADQGQLEQVLMNLAVNARDAMPAGGTLRISTRAVTVPPGLLESAPQLLMQPGQYVELAVADDGEGIPPEVLPHIFEPFFTTKGVGKGTGLGLSTVYGIVQQCGGFIRAESPNGRGAVFRIWLPAEPFAGEGNAANEPAHTPMSGSLSI